jgi:uncharacterized protein (TIGR03083 family)
MDVAAHIDELAVQGKALAEAAAAAGPDAPVPTCPGWTVADLLAHTGGVHRWAASFVRADPDADPGAALDEPEGEPVGWYLEQHAALVDALRAAPPDLQTWTFLAAPSPLAFWARRQAHETAVHRADAAAAAGPQVPGYPVGFAVDGIDELLFGFFGFRARKRRLRSDAELTLLVAPDDTDDRWLVTIGAEGAGTERAAGPAGCTLRGPVERLYLYLWNRVPDVAIEGDPAVVALWREQARVRWS